MSRMPGFSAESTLYSSTGRYQSRAGDGVFSALVEPSSPLGLKYLSSYTVMDFYSLLSSLCCLNMNLKGDCPSPAACWPLPYGQCHCFEPIGGGKQNE